MQQRSRSPSLGPDPWCTPSHEVQLDAGCKSRASARVLNVLGEANAEELPPVVRIEEVAVARADVPGRRDARTAASDPLVAHEFAVVLAERAVERPEPRVRAIGRSAPFPNVSPKL